MHGLIGEISCTRQSRVTRGGDYWLPSPPRGCDPSVWVSWSTLSVDCTSSISPAADTPRSLQRMMAHMSGRVKGFLFDQQVYEWHHRVESPPRWLSAYQSTQWTVPPCRLICIHHTGWTLPLVRNIKGTNNLVIANEEHTRWYKRSFQEASNHACVYSEIQLLCY